MYVRTYISLTCEIVGISTYPWKFVSVLALVEGEDDWILRGIINGEYCTYFHQPDQYVIHMEHTLLIYCTRYVRM